MQSQQYRIKKIDEIATVLDEIKSSEPSFLLAFGAPEYFKDETFSKLLKEKMPNTLSVGCSTAGEIDDDGIYENELILTSVKMDSSVAKVFGAPRGLSEADSAKLIGDQLKSPDLKSVVLLSHGINVHGTNLLNSLREVIGEGATISGGLAGDNGKFEDTFTLVNGETSEHGLVALGLYGDNLKVTTGSWHGWRPFGPVRKVTKCEGNVVRELDGKPAMDFYMKYVSENVIEKPEMKLLYPFAVLNNEHDETGMIRAIQGADEKEGTMTLAGDIKEGAYVRLMHANNDDLIKGAKSAAQQIQERTENDGLAILISCIARKLVMNDETEDEVDAVKDVLKNAQHVSGFYSYGEFCPFQGFVDTMLHNQTMTITYISEEEKQAA